MTPTPSGDTRTALTSRAGIVVNYRTGATVLLTGDALSKWLTAVQNSPAPPPVTIAESVPSWGTDENTARLDHLLTPPWAWRTSATACLLITLAVRHLGSPSSKFGRMARLAETGRRLPRARTAHARAAVLSVRWAARAIPARVACLEESTAASLLLAVGRRGGAWRHGIAADPIRLHAWICDAQEEPVEEPERTKRYTPINVPNPTGTRT
ncbi:lasso peptide biosynthesis B2 protein [Kitasatospora sp. NPDC058397]|uniref:lasso peptide biosynthesis B2 protein n=1 Tax=unclassified Kitasatospora TaxID=2633591 RepID=UPI003669C491